MIANIRRQTRAKYHQSIKWIKRNETNIKNEKLAELLVTKDNSSFWENIKRLKGNIKYVPCSIDNESGDKNIASLFSEKFSLLYNSVSYNLSEMKTIEKDIKTNICNMCKTNECLHHVSNISVTDIVNAIDKLKPGKNDCLLNLSTDHIIHGTPRLFILLSLLFTCMISHGYCPPGMLTGTMIPIPKIKGTTSSDNFRAITLSNTFSKIFDQVVIDKCKRSLKTSNLQFGFKKNSSTDACTFIVQETVSFYNNNNNNVFCTMIDASKAFDRLAFCSLFKKLIERKFCSLIIRLLLFMYLNQSLSVRWNSTYSSSFSVSNGVKQGGIISPILYCIYIDDLLLKLKNSGNGCTMGYNYCGALGYADDLILLSPTVSSMKMMLGICETYAKKHKINFNAKKAYFYSFLV